MNGLRESKMATSVLVTGANGFVGSHIVDCMLRRGYHVRTMVRPTSDLTWLENKPVELVFGSLNDPSSLLKAVEGVGKVVHNAGIVAAEQKYLYYLHNSEGTHNLIKAVLDVHTETNRPRFLLVSSQAAGGPSGVKWRQEKDSPSPITHYGRSKLLAESTLMRYRDKLPVTIVRPPAVYGPRDRAFLPLFKMIACCFMPQIGPDRLVSFIHVQDLARQIGDQLEHEAAVGEIFNAAPFDPIRLAEFGNTIATVLSSEPRKLIIPPELLKYGYPLVYPLLNALTTPPFLVDKLPDLLETRWTLDGTKAAELIGFQGQLPLLAGIGQTAEWYRWKKWLTTRRDKLNNGGKTRSYMRPMSDSLKLYNEGCDLCGLAFDREIKTPIHYEDDDFIIVDCMICHVPMAVLKEHRAKFTPHEKERITAKFKELFGEAATDFEQRRIPEHAHVHNRKHGHSPPWTRRPEDLANESSAGPSVRSNDSPAKKKPRKRGKSAKNESES
jgi:nucleoside-diphosphate-sugar epimerase